MYYILRGGGLPYFFFFFSAERSINGRVTVIFACVGGDTRPNTGGVVGRARKLCLTDFPASFFRLTLRFYFDSSYVDIWG